MDITVCTGGACSEAGAELLLDACSVLAAGDPSIEVKSAFCSGECPANRAMLSPRRGAIEAYEAKGSTVDECIASATAAIAQAESQVGDGLTEAFVALAEAKAAALAGDAATARERYAAALAGAPAGLLEPCQPELTRTPRGLRWVRRRYAYQPPALGTYRTHRAACPRAPRTVRTGYAYQPRALGTYSVPWHPRRDARHRPGCSLPCVGRGRLRQRGDARGRRRPLARLGARLLAGARGPSRDEPAAPLKALT